MRSLDIETDGNNRGVPESKIPVLFGLANSNIVAKMNETMEQILFITIFKINVNIRLYKIGH